VSLGKIKFPAAGLLFATAVFFAPNQALAECSPFPKVELWGDMSHASVRAYVGSRFDGDWGTYIKKLNNIKAGLQDIQRRGKGAVIKLKGQRVILKDNKLADYLQLTDERIGIVHCLAEQAEAASLQNFTTAAGGNDSQAGSGFPKPVEKRQDYRTYVTLPMQLVEKLRKQAERRSVLENRKVSVSDIIVRSLKRSYATATE